MADMLCKDSQKYSVREYTSIKERFNLTGKKALITGGAGGIGRSTAQAFAELGADVALMDVPSRQADLERVAELITKKYVRNAIVVTGDVADQASVRDFVAKAEAELGGIDILHNNAGIILLGDHADVEIEKWNRLININVTGMFLVGREVANVMIHQQRGGAIINTASMSGHIINRAPNEEYGFAYTTSKAAVMHLTKAMAVQYIKYGIRVNSISPGVVISGIHDNIPEALMEAASGEIPIKRFGYLNEIADAVVFMATDMASFMVGSDMLIDGGQTIN